MIEEFISKLTGKYNNLRQAQSSPRDHSHVHIRWKNLGGPTLWSRWRAYTDDGSKTKEKIYPDYPYTDD